MGSIPIIGLKDFLRAHGLSTTGVKKDLLRLAKLYFSYPVLRLPDSTGPASNPEKVASALWSKKRDLSHVKSICWGTENEAVAREAYGFKNCIALPLSTFSREFHITRNLLSLIDIWNIWLPFNMKIKTAFIIFIRLHNLTKYLFSNLFSLPLHLVSRVMSRTCSSLCSSGSINRNKTPF